MPAPNKRGKMREPGKADFMAKREPELEWLDGDVPHATGFGDTYFSKAGGLEETRHVFIGGNRLPERLPGRTGFTIAEFGFGTGLNFLTTLDMMATVEKAPDLTFLSFELYPLSADQLERALAAFPALSGYFDELLRAWAPVPGWNRMQIAGADLLLGIGDAREMISDLVVETGSKTIGRTAIPAVDAWYLDGFSPAKNPELWAPDLLAKAAELTAPAGTFATYTAAGWVRRNLQAAGFTVEKKPGFAGKREMIVGWKT
ncbi:tRNA (5-methylaminomethyl-2-thiouridine)(34)-methyltransferase MnmD [Roseibium sp. MMSF_3412]|uniref:tRNA (5-methylaminomethyl-2-thiouridine)(34)-methyltransferase MnmD n=1 Tax=Roseibium sp. MMSF_3412 TaxID=3046712 RepID=UPI0030147413